MGSVNLIPAERLAARRLRRRIRRWAVVCATQALLVVIAATALHAARAGEDRGLSEQLAAAQQQVEQDNRATLELRRGLTEAAMALEMTRVIRNGADWSRLFVGLSDRLGDQIVLSRCQLLTIGADNMAVGEDSRASLAGKPLAAFLDECRYRLTLHGFGLTQESVSQFVLRLEGTGLFDPVRLVASSRQSFLDKEAVAFTIECHF